ncbi:hypothetical protein BC939DRAFT_456393 [Gamsiella multidivaricata]|uniref:uncharacterized protein n=1 Tax=Gamsiella multidivaricata TaxID=101098 RepID=UPI0022206D05|nr:uncharacterized protein BC939DRAFT_456393 [Gamsiella multidivaricata]KAI7821059.1 hypothetical protein BC939DRAFT_456393 [Gamsiella multidivaricata]
MIVIFLVDTSASMNQKFSSGMSALECTKSGIEHLIKHLPHVKPAEKHNDKFMLVTYEEGPGCVRSSLKDPLPHLIKELKILNATDMSNPGASLSTVFDLLNVYRVYHGIDTPASGRFPATIEPTIILWFTDGGKQSSPAGALDRLNIPGITFAGVDYYHEPFRWDQRLYTIFLEPNAEMVDPQLSVLSTVMGGTSYRVRTLRHMLQAMDCMLGISKIPPTQFSPQALLHIYGVVVNFEDLIADPRRPNTANHHQLIYVNPSWLNPQSRHPGFFPIPEPFWPELDAQRIPTRNAQPTLHYHTKDEKRVDIPEGFPFDKYVVAPCPMTQELLTRPSESCWPVYVKNSYKTEGFGFPFAFLRANTNKTAVTLTVVAYNYPALFTLMVNLYSLPDRTPTPAWLRDFSEYLSHTPSYYYTPLRNALKRMGIVNIIPSDQGMLSPAVLKIISKNKIQAKSELDRLLSAEPSLTVDPVGLKKKTLCTNAFDVPRSELISVLSDLKRSFFKELQLRPASALATSSPDMAQKSIISGSSRAIDARLDLFADSDDLHSLPIADMGIYQDRMQKIQQENLRDPFRDEESAKSLQRTMFGNPYKQDKKVSIDEEDEASAADSSISSNSTSSGSSWSSILGRKRKPRRRSVSSSHFPIEKIPSLAQGGRSISGKVQLVSFGPSGTRTVLPPILKVLVEDGSGKPQSSSYPTDTLSRHLGMHDGEDEDEEEDDFRRAMFNSDEMEMDGDDEAARLRADTPMPGGIGLDDDDVEMEDMQCAQEMIPAPIISISLDDIATDNAGLSFAGKGKTASDLLASQEYEKHRQGVEDDLQQLNGTAIPIFDSLVYDPTALMELQSIPHMIPERTPSGAAALQMHANESLSSSPSLQDNSDVEAHAKNTDVMLGTNSNPHDLMPIPILRPPSEDVNRADANAPALTEAMRGPNSSVIGSKLDHADPSISDGLRRSSATSGEASDMSTNNMEIERTSAVPNTEASMEPRTEPSHTIRDQQVRSASFSAVPNSMSTGTSVMMDNTPLEYKHAMVRQIKMSPKFYNEAAILDMVWKVNAASNWTKEQKRIALSGCLVLAKGLRRVAVVSALESLRNK